MNVTDEWIFYKIKIYFKFVDLKIYLRLVAKIYLLRSNCFYKMPEHFEMDLVTLEERFIERESAMETTSYY